MIGLAYTTDMEKKKTVDELSKAEVNAEDYRWFYEGRNGWWQYELRTAMEIETAYNGGAKHCELMIGAFFYVIDFDNMFQHRRDEPSRKRRIKRDLISAPNKGVAGLKVFPQEKSRGDKGAFTPSTSSKDTSSRASAVSADEVEAVGTVTTSAGEQLSQLSLN